jgi:hypothetical protein
MKKWFTRIAALAAIALSSAAIGITVYVPTVSFNGVPVRLHDAPPPAYAASAASGVTAMPPSTQFPINAKAMPKRNYGSDQLRIRNKTDGSVPVQLADGGAFRITCATSFLGHFDPLVYPGQENKSHLHNFFGHSDITFSTDPSTDLATFGRSTCAGGSANRSGYWTPSLVHAAGKYKGFPIPAWLNVVYYKHETDWRRANKTVLYVPPPGLRMIAGDPKNTNSNGNGTYRWQCMDGVSPMQYTIPTSCANGKEVMLLVFFPQCWDGVNLDSPNHQSHMAYENNTTGCPQSHPYPIPQISFNIHYPVSADSRPENWRLSSDTYSMGLPGGMSAHGDWWNGWNTEVLTTMVECLKASWNMHANMLCSGGTGTPPYRILY